MSTVTENPINEEKLKESRLKQTNLQFQLEISITPLPLIERIRRENFSRDIEQISN